VAAPGGSEVSGVSAKVREALAAVRGTKISQALARMIARDIAERGLEPGAKLPNEQLMAQDFGVGRNSVREALRLLEAQGMVEIRPGLRGGPVVGEPTGEDFGRTMTLFLQMKGALVADVLDAQVGLEGLLASSAAANVDAVAPSLVEAMMEASVTPQRGLSDSDWLRAGLRFHAAVKAMVPNPVLVLVVDAVGVVLADRIRSDEHISWTLRERRRIADEHVALAEAIRDGEVEVARVLAERHQRRSNESVRRFYPGLAEELIDWH
jgi:DNA-binding FadR family transcriptional regulator